MAGSKQVKKVLIAEDEKPLARALSLKLDDPSLQVDVEHDGATVLDKILKGSYDLVLMDLMMPKLNGFSILEEVKKEGKEVSIIVMSNLSQDSDMNRAKDLGAVHYFIKGDTKLSDIISYVKKYLKI